MAHIKMNKDTMNTTHRIVTGFVVTGSLLFGMGLAGQAATLDVNVESGNSAKAGEGQRFASVDDFEAMSKLNESEQKSLIAALESAPDNVARSDNPDALYTHLEKELGANGEASSPQVVPAVILAARAAACLGSSYVALRGISSDSPPDVIAGSIAAAVAGCVTGGGASVIKNAILKNKGLIAKGLKAIGLGALAAGLTGDTPRSAVAVRSVHSSSATDAPATRITDVTFV